MSTDKVPASLADFVTAMRTDIPAPDPIKDILDEILQLNRRKRADYAANDDIFSNFRHSADQIKQGPMASVEVLIATKQARLRELMWSGKTPNNESVEDTLLDRAVYSVIALALYRETTK